MSPVAVRCTLVGEVLPVALVDEIERPEEAAVVELIRHEIEVWTSIPSACVIRVLEDLIRLYGRPARVRIENGPELVAEVFVDWWAAHSNGLSSQGSPIKTLSSSGSIGAFGTRCSKPTSLTLSSRCDVTKAWLEIDNTERPHDSLGQVPP